MDQISGFPLLTKSTTANLTFGFLQSLPPPMFSLEHSDFCGLNTYATTDFQQLVV